MCVRHYKILTKTGPSRQVNARPIRTQGGRFVQWQKVPACQATAAAPASDSPEALKAPQAAAGAGRSRRASMGEAAASAQQLQAGEASETSARARKSQRAAKDQAAAYEEEEESDAPLKASAKDRKRRRASESHAAPSAPEAHALSTRASKHCIGLQNQAAVYTETVHLDQDSEASAGAYKRQQASDSHAAASAEAAQPDGVPEAAAGARKGRHTHPADVAAPAKEATSDGASLPSGRQCAQGAQADDRQHTAHVSKSADHHKAAEAGAGAGQGNTAPRPATRSQAAALDTASADRRNTGHAESTRMRSRRHKSGQC